MSKPAAILDVDGTLVDSNYHHALAWYRAFRQSDVTIPLSTLHRHIGMGGDQLVEAVAGKRIAADQGDEIRAAHSVLYQAMIAETAVLPGARELVRALKDRGQQVVLASSASADEVEHYLDLLDVRETLDGWTTSADVKATKPEPDLINAALEKLGGGSAVMLGDSVWDCVAAKKAGVPIVGVLTGGFAEAELRKAGAIAVFGSAQDLLDHLPETPFGAS